MYLLFVKNTTITNSENLKTLKKNINFDYHKSTLKVFIYYYSNTCIRIIYKTYLTIRHIIILLQYYKVTIITYVLSKVHSTKTSFVLIFLFKKNDLLYTVVFIYTYKITAYWENQKRIHTQKLLLSDKKNVGLYYNGLKFYLNLKCRKVNREYLTSIDQFL